MVSLKTDKKKKSESDTKHTYQIPLVLVIFVTKAHIGTTP